LKYPPFPWAQNFQDDAHQTTGAQRKIFEKGTIFFGHPVQDVCQLWPIVTVIPKEEFVSPPSGYQLIMVSPSLPHVIILLILQKQLIWS
jgi:hypothetical protein